VTAYSDYEFQCSMSSRSKWPFFGMLFWIDRLGELFDESGCDFTM